MDELKNIIESLLFVSEEPLTVEQIRKVVQTAETGAVKEALASLKSDYEARGGGFTMAEVAGGFQLRTRTEYSDYIKALLQPSPPRLSKAALETLAIIAYKQPIIRADLEHLRGVDSGGVLRLLLKRKLIRVLGRKEIPGRPLIYATTKRFLETFELKDLRDLPTPKEIQELGSEASDELAAAFEALSLPEDGPVPPQTERGLFDALPDSEPAPGGRAEGGGETEPAEAENGADPEAAGSEAAEDDDPDTADADRPSENGEEGLQHTENNIENNFHDPVEDNAEEPDPDGPEEETGGEGRF